MSCCLVDHSSRPQTEECCEISFVEMDNTEPVDFQIVDVFGNDCSDYFLPSRETISGGGAEIEECKMYRENLAFGKLKVFVVVVIRWR